MQSPTDQAGASIPTETVREGPHLNPLGTFTVHRKAAKRSERWYQTASVPLPPSPEREDIPARKKRRIEEDPLPASTDEAARNTASPDVSSVGLPPPVADHDESDAEVDTNARNKCASVPPPKSKQWFSSVLTPLAATFSWVPLWSRFF
jgi:hypothetical protein